jgi:hypothetical protein
VEIIWRRCAALKAEACLACNCEVGRLVANTGFAPLSTPSLSVFGRVGFSSPDQNNS